MQIRLISLCFFISFFIFSCQEAPQEKPQRVQKESVFGEKAMVVSEHPLSTEVGINVLKNGGNAFDAAVAVQFAEAVVIPFAGNIGGGGFMVARKNDGTVMALDYREMAPSAAHRDMYLDDSGNVIENLSWLGHLAVGVPGTVHGMFALHDSLGTKPISELIQPAIALARNGFPITAIRAKGLNEKLENIKERSTKDNAFTTKAEWKEGDLLVQEDLAKTLERIRDNGLSGFYEGETADKIVAEMERGNGIITLEDLKNYRSVWREPIQGQYREYGVISMPPPSSGGIALVQLLELIEPFDIGSYGFHSPEAIHLMVEAERRVYADRAEHLGDSDFYPVPRAGLLDDEYLDERMNNFSPDSATDSEVISAGTPAPPESEETTHYSIVDPFGNAVSMTTTLNGGYGSCVVVGDAGFFLNNEMDDFSSKPGEPNKYGLLGAEANSIEPGKRMLSAMTPTILTKDGSLFMVLGTPGGSTIITSVFQNIINVADFGMGMQESVNAYRFHHQWKPNVVMFEEGAFSPELMKNLRALGHELYPRDQIGRVEGVLVLPDGRLEGGADPRRDDTAMGF